MKVPKLCAFSCAAKAPAESLPLLYVFCGGAPVVVAYINSLSFSRMRTEPAVTISVLSAVVFVIAYFASNFCWSPAAWSARQGRAPRAENKIATTVIDSIALRETIATSLIRVSCNA